MEGSSGRPGHSVVESMPAQWALAPFFEPASALKPITTQRDRLQVLFDPARQNVFEQPDMEVPFWTGESKSFGTTTGCNAG